MVFLDDGLNCCVPVRLWLFAHSLFDFLGTTTAGSADIGLSTPVKIRIECHMPDRRRRDLDNLQKAAFDALTKSGFWLDDQQVDYYSVKRMPIVKGGRLELTITEMEAA